LRQDYLANAIRQQMENPPLKMAALTGRIGSSSP
jgi:hypothetical protein